jgi:hypothetical protein
VADPHRDDGLGDAGFELERDVEVAQAVQLDVRQAGAADQTDEVA